MGCLLGQTRNEPSLASDSNRKAVISAAIHWWLCWKMTYSVSKLFMVLRRCQSLVNLYPCFLFGIHFVVTWVHIARKKGFYFSGRVLEFGITVSQSVFISVVLFLSRQMSDLLVSYYENCTIHSNSQKLPPVWISLFPKCCADLYWQCPRMCADWCWCWWLFVI